MVSEASPAYPALDPLVTLSLSPGEGAGCRGLSSGQPARPCSFPGGPSPGQDGAAPRETFGAKGLVWLEIFLGYLVYRGPTEGSEVDLLCFRGLLDRLAEAHFYTSCRRS